jgi:hypothetical protein
MRNGASSPLLASSLVANAALVSLIVIRAPAVFNLPSSGMVASDRAAPDHPTTDERGMAAYKQNGGGWLQKLKPVSK